MREDRARLLGLLAAAALLLSAGGARAAETVDVTVPPGVSFNVTDVTQNTAAPTVTLSFTNASLNGNHQLEISVMAAAPNFTPPAGTVTIPASNVTWTATTPDGTATGGTLSATTYTRIYISSRPCPASGSVDITFTLAAPGTGIRAGDHTLPLRWMFDSVNK